MRWSVEAVNRQAGSGVQATVDVIARLRLAAHAVFRPVQRGQLEGGLVREEVDGAPQVTVDARWIGEQSQTHAKRVGRRLFQKRSRPVRTGIS